jgi:hypothetical protein
MKLSDIKSYIEGTSGPAIEIAGPTLHGYAFLDKHAIQMPLDLIITNIAKQIEVWDRRKDTMVLKSVDEVANITNLPYETNSVSLLFVSNLSITAGNGNDAIKEAKREYEHPLDPVTNLHLFLYKEASRVLVPNGLLIQVGAFEEDLDAILKYPLTNEFNFIDNEETIVLRRN